MFRPFLKIAPKAISKWKGTIYIPIQQLQRMYISSQPFEFNRQFTTTTLPSQQESQSEFKNISDVMKKINTIDSALSLERCADMIFSDPTYLSSSIIVRLLKKAGDLQCNNLLYPLFLRFYNLIGYSDIVTNELIDQYCRYYNLEGIADLYKLMKKDNILFSKSTYEKFLLSLLRSIQYEHICINITREMFTQNYLISSTVLFKALSLPAVCDSEIFIAILSLTKANEIPVHKIEAILGKRLISFSKANREVSVLELYHYLSVLSPKKDRKSYIPYITKSLKYFFDRNMDIKYDCNDNCFMIALTQALLQSRFNKPQDIRGFIQFIIQTPSFHQVNLSSFFLHFAKMQGLSVTNEDWLALKECSIHMDLTEIVQTGKQLVATQSKELCYGFLVLNEEILLKASEEELVQQLKQCVEKKEEKEKIKEKSMIEKIKNGIIEEQELFEESVENRIELTKKVYSLLLETSKEDNERIQSIFYQLITSLPSFNTVEQIMKECVSLSLPFTQLEAKQFILAYLKADRKQEAEKICQLLWENYHIASPSITKQFLQKGYNLPTD